MLAAAQAAVSRIQAVVAESNTVAHLFDRPPPPSAAAATSADEGEDEASPTGSLDGTSRGTAAAAAAGESDFLEAANDACERLSEKVEVWAAKVNPGAIGQLADKVCRAERRCL